MLIKLENFPVFYFPYLRGNVEDPLGPLEGLNFNYSRIFGFQLMTAWDMYDLLGVNKTPGTRWRLMVDYLSLRGPALGTEYDFTGKDLFGIKNTYQGLVKAYGIYDTGLDVLGGNRGQLIFISPTTFVPVTHPDLRGRFQS